MLTSIKKRRTMLNERRQLQHGWEVDLPCPKCGIVAIPVFNGWTPNQKVGFGKTSTICANLNCPRCDADLKEVAGEKLAELFVNVSVPPRNRNAILGYVLLSIALLVCLGGNFWMRQPAFAWLYPVIVVMFTSSRYWFTRYVHSARYQCDCGNPCHKFMGMLGRSYCFRCSSCGRLLRIRD